MTGLGSLRPAAPARLVVAGLIVVMAAGGCSSVPPSTAPASPPAGTFPDTCPDLMVVPCQFQSAELSIPIVGTAFSLHYSSTRAPGRKVAPSDTGATDIGGWTISVLAHLDVKAGLWLGGTGATRHVTPTRVGDSLVVVSADAAVADVFDASGQETRRVDAITGLDVEQFAYADGKLASITDTYGKTTFERGGAGEVTAIVAPLLARSLIYVDSIGALDSILSPSGRDDRFSYGAGGLLTSWTDRDGRTASYQYDDSGLLTQVGNRDGTQTTLRRTVIGGSVTVEATRTGVSVPTRWTVEPTGDGWTWSVAASSGATVSEVVRTGGRSVRFGDGTTLEIILAADPSWGDEAPIVSALTLKTPSGRVLEASETRSIAGGDPLSATTRDGTITIAGNSTKRHFDAATRTATVTSAAGRAMTVTFGAFDRVVALQRPASAPVSFVYDDHGRVTDVVLGKGPAARHYEIGWDAEANAVRIKDPTGATSTVAYDGDGRAQVWQRADGQRIVLDRSDAGAPVGVSVDGNPVFTIGVNSNGQLVSYAPAGGDELDVTRLEYAGGQLKSVTQPDGTAANLRYDDNGRLAGMNAGAGEYAPTYDQAGSVVGWKEPNGEQTSQRLDGGLASELGWSGLVNGTITLGRDPLGRITSLSIGTAAAIEFSYDADGLPTKVGDLSLTRDPATGRALSTTAGVVTTKASFDALGQRASLSASVATGDLFRETLTRDPLGRIVRDETVVAGDRSTTTYRYDAGGRLASVSVDGRETTFGYDDRDDLTALAGATSRSYAINGRNEITSDGSRTFTWTTAGTLASIVGADGAKTAFQFDARGELTAVDPSTGRRIEYQVGERGQLLGRVVGGSLLAGYLYVPGAVGPVAQVDASGAVVATFEYAGTGAPVLMQKGGRTYRILADHLGSPRLVVNTATGEVVERLDYDALGRIVADTNPGFEPFGFTGGLADPDTGLVRLGVRWYDPTTGRWISPDPALIAGGPNLYEYANDDWTNQVDRNGRYPTPDLGPIDLTSPFSGDETADPNQSMSLEPADVPLPSSSDANASEGASEGAATGEGGEGEGSAALKEAGQVGLASGIASILLGFAGHTGEAYAPGVGILFGVIEVRKGIEGLQNNEGSSTSNGGKIASGAGEILISVGTLTAQPELVLIGFALVVTGTVAQIAGDPHFASWDGNRFDFQGVGEFVLAHDPGGGFDVQVRLEPRGSSRIVSVVTALAIGLPGGHRVGIYRGAPHELLVDGKPVDLPAGAVEIGGGARVTHLLSGHYLISLTDKSFAMEVSPRGGASINLRLAIAPNASRHLVGLLGSPDGNPGNDFTLRDGAVLTNPDFTAIHHQFGEDWRVTAAESLFDYGPGKSTATYTDRSFPDHAATVNDVDPAARDAATIVCQGAGIVDPVVLSACIVDVGLLHDPSFAAGLVDENAASVMSGSGAAPSPTPVEQTGKTEEITIPVSISGSLANAAAVDHYTFLLAAGDTLFLRGPTCSDDGIRWGLTDPSGASLGPLQDQEICSNIGRVIGTATGTYTITVSSVPSGAGGPYTFDVLRVPPDQTIAISIGQTVGQDQPAGGAGNIDAPGAIDYYTFSVTSAPQLVYLHSEPPCTNNELRWNLRDPSGALVNDNETNRLCFDIGRLTLATPGTYTVTVSGVQNSDATGTYGFTVLPVAPDQVFGIRIGDSVGPGQPGTGAGSIETPGAIDRYTFQANAGQAVQLTAVQPCGNNELRWNVRDPTGAIVNADDINRICSDIGRLVLNTAGTYVITVFSISDNPATGTYGFALKPG